jgi:hypothetical protein
MIESFPQRRLWMISRSLRAGAVLVPREWERGEKGGIRCSRGEEGSESGPFGAGK